MKTPHEHSRHPHHSPRGPSSRTARSTRRLATVLAMQAAYMVAEVVGALLTGSLALLADAGHMLTDVAALALSLFAVWVAKRPPTSSRTYGYYRIEILAALVNGAALVAIAAYISLEAYSRLSTPVPVLGGPMLVVACGGLAVNIVGLFLLNSGKGESLNMRGAWLHLVSDALGSVGAIVAGLLIWKLGWNQADVAASFLISILVVYSSWSLLKEVVAVLMEGAPGHIDVDGVRDSIASLDGVLEVHDLHIWTISSGMEALSGHVVVADGSRQQDLLARIRALVLGDFGIGHITIQIEASGFEESDVCP